MSTEICLFCAWRVFLPSPLSHPLESTRVRNWCVSIECDMFNIITWKRSHEATYFTASHAIARMQCSEDIKFEQRRSFASFSISLPAFKTFTHVLALPCCLQHICHNNKLFNNKNKTITKKKTITNECMRDKNTSFHYNSRCFAFYGIILHFRSLSLLYSGSMKFNVFFCRDLFLLFFLSNIFRQFLLLITGTRRRTGYSYKDGSGWMRMDII